MNKDKWTLLKQRLETYSAKQYCEDDGPCSGEFRAGFDRALGWVDNEMAELENPKYSHTPYEPTGP